MSNLGRSLPFAVAAVLVISGIHAPLAKAADQPQSNQPAFTKNLWRGSSGSEVRKLQEYLKATPDIYPEGSVTGYFGILTEKAVKKFQAKYKIEQTGTIGPKTRSQINALIKTPPLTGPALNANAALSPAQTFSCPDELRTRRGLPTLAVTNGAERIVGGPEQDWINANCDATQGTKGHQGWTYNQPVTTKLPSCVGNELLSVSPIDTNLVKRLIALGHIGTPKHALPMDHMEYVVPQDEHDKTIRTNVKAAAAMHIIGVRQSLGKKNGVPITNNDYYSIAFTPCKEVIFYFEAMGSISDALKQEVEKAKNTEIVEGNYDEDPNGNKILQYRIDYVAKPGEVIGTVGGPNTLTHTLDWGVYDFRIPRLGFLGTPVPDPRTAYTTCPIDYFPAALRDELYQKFDRKTAPRCGEVMQDLAGTIQGNWLGQGYSGDIGDTMLGIAHDNRDPSIGVIAISGMLASHGAIDFTPQHSGLINREPSEVKADGQIYCYQSGSYDQVSSAPVISGRILLQLLSDGSLRAERQNLSCASSYFFSSPMTYKR